MVRWARLALFSIVVAAQSISAEPVASLTATNYVNDFAGALSGPTQTQLNALCQQVDQKAQAQIAVATVKSLDGEDVVTYAVALYQKWGIGAKGKDRGVLILVATQDHKYWTTVGYGLEAILPDGKVGGFGREAVPLLKVGDFDGAVTLLTGRVASVIAQDAGVTLDNQPHLAASPRPMRAPAVSPGATFFLLLLVFFVVIPILLSIFRGGGGGGRGGGSGFMSGLLWSLLFSNLGGGRGGGFGGGGFGGGGFGGGGGGGGFGGFGGGSTGGGGAGGSW